jgi:TolB-like protein
MITSIPYRRVKGKPMRIKRILLFALVACLALSGSAAAQTKDAGRIYKVAILPFLINSQENLDYLRDGIQDILTSRLSVDGKVVVIERTAVERALYEDRPMRLDETVAARIGNKVGADYVVLGSVTKIGNYISLDARLISLTEDKPPVGVFTQHKGIDDVMTKMGDFAQEMVYKILGRRPSGSRSSDGRQPYLFQQGGTGGRRSTAEGTDYRKSQTFDFEIKALDIGDVDGDKKNEIVFTDQNNVYVFKYDGERLNLMQKINIGYQHTFLSLDVADINRNGIAEIIVTSVVDDRLQSFILEYEEGRFRKIVDKSEWFYRVVDYPKEGPILMGQRQGGDGVPNGPVYRFLWKSKGFERGPKLPFAPDTFILNVAPVDLKGTGKVETLQYDKNDYLRLLDEKGRILWKSTERLGGTSNYYETLKKTPDGWKAVDRMPWRVVVPTRLTVKDVYGDGSPLVLLPKNDFSVGSLTEKVRTYEKGLVVALAWDGERLVTEWKTREIPGYIADAQFKDADNDGEPELVLAVPQAETDSAAGFFGKKKEKSNIYFFKLF